MAMHSDPAGVIAHGASWRQSLAVGNTLGVASMVTWAAGFPAAEFLLQSWPPVTLVTARLALAILALVPVWLLIDGPRRVANARWGRALWVGGLGFGLGTYLLLFAQSLTDPVTVALIASCAPLIGAGLELVARSRRLTWRFAIGVSVSVLGGLLATSALAPAQIGLGALCAVISTALYTWASMATARDFPGLSVTGRGTITLIGGFVATSVLCAGTVLAGYDIMPKRAFDMQQAGMLAIYAIIAFGISQVFFISAVGRLGVAVASFHINIAPFYVMIIMVSLGADWNWTQAGGAVIVAFGVVLAQGRNRV